MFIFIKLADTALKNLKKLRVKERPPTFKKNLYNLKACTMKSRILNKKKRFFKTPFVFYNKTKGFLRKTDLISSVRHTVKI